MATDRFAELADLCVVPEPEPEPEPEQVDDSGGGGGQGTAEAEFWPMRAKLHDIQQHVASIRSAQIQLLSSAFSTGALREDLENRNAQVAELSSSLRSQLRTMGAELDAAESGDPEIARRSTSHRMRRNIHVTMTVKLVNAMGLYQDLQLWFHRATKVDAQRQLLVANPAATAEELEQVGEGSGEQIFARMIARGQAAAALEDVQQKHATIVQIERDVAEVHELMVELAEVSEQ